MSAKLDEVFTPGGQPSVTYVDRQESHVEKSLSRALAVPNMVASLAAPTKSGKTVLCHRVLEGREYVWIDGGEVKGGPEFWQKVCSELDLPTSTSDAETEAGTLDGGLNLGVKLTGSRTSSFGTTEHRQVHSMSAAMKDMLDSGTVLVIDDFHYIEPETRTELMRNVKGSVFKGLKVLLLSVTHRVYDALTAEGEMTGRFRSVQLPEWTPGELRQIAEVGFRELKVDCPNTIINRFVAEAQNSPMLMQQFCWELCYDLGITEAKLVTRHSIPLNYDIEALFQRIAEDAGLPVYQTLAKGPQAKGRAKRPLKGGGEADIYEVTLAAMAETGPRQSISYEEVRSNVSALLADNVPQGHEITSALKHLAKISLRRGQSAVDWDEPSRQVTLSDPYLRFFLRWKVRSNRN